MIFSLCAALTSPTVIAGLVPAIPISQAWCPPKRDGRDKPGHDRSEA
jgi:hypothetical protein